MKLLILGPKSLLLTFEPMKNLYVYTVRTTIVYITYITVQKRVKFRRINFTSIKLLLSSFTVLFYRSETHN